jgi:hypothetical protein
MVMIKLANVDVKVSAAENPDIWGFTKVRIMDR